MISLGDPTAIVGVLNRYKMPVAFLGMLSVLALWDTLRVYINSRGLRLDSFHCRCLQVFGNLGEFAPEACLVYELCYETESVMNYSRCFAYS